MNDLRKKINAAHTYYLNENGSTVNYRGKAVTSAQAQYKQVLLAGYTTSNYEPIYAWRQRKQDGSYGEFLLGTQLDFDLHVINNLHSKNHKKKTHMKTKQTLFLLAVSTVLASCTTTRYGMARTTLDDAVESIKEEYYEKGYYLTSEITGQAISSQFSNTRDARNSVYAADNANSKADYYAFQDSTGNTLQFTIAYNEAMQGQTMYLLDVGTIGCQTSNPKDYMSLCGKSSPISKIKQIPNDMKVVVGDMTKTQKTILWTSFIIGAGSILASIFFISSM